MAILKNNNKSHSFMQSAFCLPWSHTNCTSLNKHEPSSCISTTTTTTTKQTKEHVITSNLNNDRNANIKSTTRRVTFRATARMRVVTRTKDLAEDPKDLWYTANEYNRIHRKALSIVRAVDNDDNLVKVGKQRCVRGLERHLASSKHTIAATRNDAWSSVFEEQFMQYEANEEYDDEQISSVYIPFSIKAHMEAHERGLSDAREAQRCMMTRSGQY